MIHEDRIHEDRMNHNPPHKILQDLKTSGARKGESRPWGVKKIMGYNPVESFMRLGDMDRAEKLLRCGTLLKFLRNPWTGELRLYSANFCKDRLCPTCNWRRSLRQFSELSSVAATVMSEHGDWRPIFFSLTVRNCAVDAVALLGTLDVMQAGWNRLLKLKRVKGVFKGLYRTVEITYNREEDEFHLHIHVLAFVEASYFESDAYIRTEELVQLWRRAARLDYDPICDMRSVKNVEKGVAEVSKYIVKDTDVVIQGDPEVTDRIVLSLSEALRGRRLCAYGGEMKRVAAELGSDEDDLIHVGDEWNNGSSGFTEIVWYRWDFKINRHVLVMRGQRDQFEDTA